jgi:hypothetical protein
MVVNVYPLRRVVRVLRVGDVEPEAVLNKVGLTLDELRNSVLYVPLGQYHELLVAASEALQEPALGLRLAQHASRGSAGLFGFLFSHQPDFLTAVRAARTYLTAFRPGLTATLEELEGGIHRFGLSLDGDGLGRQIECEELTCLGVVLARFATRGAFRPAAVHLEGQYDGVQADWDAFIGRRPTFGSTFCAIDFPSSALELPFLGADEELVPHLIRAAEHHVADIRKAMGAPVRILPLVGCAIDLHLGVVRRNGEEIALTTKERQLLTYMAKRPNTLVPQSDIERDVWQIRGAVLTHAPAVAVRRLRQKIEEDPSKPVNLVTVRGEGWKLQITGAWGLA